MKMEVYSKSIDKERKQRMYFNQSSTQTQTSDHQQNESTLNRKEFVRCKKAHHEKSKTHSRPKELHQKATQTCIRQNHSQSESHSQQPTEKIRTSKFHQHCHQTETQTLHPAHRCPYRASRNRLPPPPAIRLASPNRAPCNHSQPKSLFNVDYAAHSRRTHHLPPLPLDDKARGADRNGAGGDCVLYKNSNFGKESSRDRSDTSELLFDPHDIQPTSMSNCHKGEGSLTKLESARERCRENKARLNAKYVDSHGSLCTEIESIGDSLHTTKSVKTVISAKSGENLRTVVRSQIEMRELLHQSISKMTELTDRLVLNGNVKMILPSLGLSDASDSIHPTDRKPPKPFKLADKEANGSVKLEAAKNRYPVTVEDIVTTKVIAPMMRRVQRMYLNNLQEEMKLMEDLERVPCQVSEVYRSVDVKDPKPQMK